MQQGVVFVCLLFAFYSKRLRRPYYYDKPLNEIDLTRVRRFTIKMFQLVFAGSFTRLSPSVGFCVRHFYARKKEKWSLS